ncbi:MAG: FAD-binding oxidoreductase [Proteobacteria bacterium]|nr:FAD-binding oxidoreductase [Pseudomonadota bacterium]
MTHAHLTPKVSPAVAIESMVNIVGKDSVLLDPQDLKSWGTDWTKVFEPEPLCIVQPKTTEAVSKILKYCNDNQLAVTPSGGRTGLCAGAVASQGEIVLSLHKMNKILDVDAVGMTITAEAGVTTEMLQNAAKDAGMFFPLDLAAKGSCQIGGNVATNAGGVKLIRYGGTREQVLGLEVVLANGEVLDMNVALRKNNSGYDLKHLFIGSEGTLGVVTKVVLRLVPKPKNLQLAIMAVGSFTDIPKILQTANASGVTITAFEFFTQVAHKIVLKHLPGARTPFQEISDYYVLLELEQAEGEGVMENLLGKLFDDGIIADATIAANSTQFKEFWGLRENITESLSAHGQVRKNDISLAIDKLEGFVAALQQMLANENPKDMDLVLFGHIGDGNLHINYVSPKSRDSKDFHSVARAIEEKVFKLLAEFKGSISAEHGIGLTKKKDLHFTRTEREVAWMRQTKKMWDPVGILNPGKIFDL